METRDPDKAPSDIDALLAEVERLRAENERDARIASAVLSWHRAEIPDYSDMCDGALIHKLPDVARLLRAIQAAIGEEP